MRKLALGVGCVALVAASLPATEARADSDAPLIATAVTLVAAAFGWDVAFTAYDSAHAVSNDEPTFPWMVAQTVVTSPQAVLGNVPIVLGQVEKDDDAMLFGVVFLPASVWGHALATYSTWSMADQKVDPRSRWAVSWMIGANLTLTTGAVSSLFSDQHYARPWISVPEIAVGGAQTIGSVYAALHDKPHQAAWIGMGAWSGTLAVHGIVSLIASLADKGHTDTYPTPYEPPATPPPPPRPPPPKPGDPVLIVPGDSPPPPPSSRREPKIPMPSVGPAPVSDGENVVPGVTVFGRF